MHSDIQRGFIRDEVIKYGDLMELGSEEAVKKAGRFHLMGKEYVIEDGDIVEDGPPAELMRRRGAFAQLHLAPPAGSAQPRGYSPCCSGPEKVLEINLRIT